jgi:type IV pilus assembly protein PilA
MKNMKKKSKKGFTLIELVVVIAILGILAAILIPVIGGFISRANKAANEANARNLYNSVAMALAIEAENLTSASSPDPLPSSVQEMFGEIASGDTWSYTVSGNIVTKAVYNEVPYPRESN